MTRIILIARGELGCEEFRSAAGSIKLLGFTSCSESNSAEAKPREDPWVLPVNSYSSVTVRICGKETWGLASLPSRAHGWILCDALITYQIIENWMLPLSARQTASQVHGAAGKTEMTGVLINLCWNKDFSLPQQLIHASDTGKATLQPICLPDAGQEPGGEQRHSSVLIRTRCFVVETGSLMFRACFMWQGGRSAWAPSPVISWQQVLEFLLLEPGSWWGSLQSLQRAPKAEEVGFVQDFETLVKIKTAVKFQLYEFNHLVTIRILVFGVKYSNCAIASDPHNQSHPWHLSTVLLALIQSRRIPHKATDPWVSFCDFSGLVWSLAQYLLQKQVGNEASCGSGRLYSPARVVHSWEQELFAVLEFKCATAWTFFTHSLLFVIQKIEDPGKEWNKY